MFVPFENLPPSSRLWIFQSDRLFIENEKDIISDTLRSFTERWKAHGNPMKASFDLRYNHFILLAVDEQHSAASGCSIDDSVRTIKELGAKLNIDFFNRNLIAFKKSNDAVELIAMKDLKAQFQAGQWSKESLTFNNLVGETGGLNQWIIPAGDTWLGRYTTPQAVTS